MIRPRWELLTRDRAETAEQVLETLLGNRGLDETFFTSPLKDLEPYLDMCGLSEGAALMANHLVGGSKVVLVGDYDCDGVTSLAQMALYLRDIGYGNYEVVIPLRSEGYGMPQRALEEHPDAGLFVLLDCGTTDFKSIAGARAAGADCIVIDHHEAPEGGAASATVLINPKQPNCPSPFKEFSSAGLTLLFLTRLRKAVGDKFSSPRLGGKYLVLATVGTVADIVPLIQGNRILVRNGLAAMNRNPYSPIREIVREAGLGNRALTAGHIGYYVGPRINAAGRVADARIAFDLLTAQQPGEISSLARDLNQLNARRQTEEEAVLKEVIARLAQRDPGLRTVVMGDSRWPSGVVGIVAARVQQSLHYGPAVIFSVDEAEGVARGSGRSIPGFDLHAAVKRCEDLVVKWGGHKMAVGMTVELDRMTQLAERLEEVAAEYPADLFSPRMKVDMELSLDLVSRELLSHLKEMEPYGMGNPAPLFAARGIRVSIEKTFGREQNHLRLLADGRVGGVFWKGASRLRTRPWNETKLLDLVFQVEWDEYRKKPVLNVKDMGQLF